jgi:beta-glucanase (GH16 family)
MRFSPTTLILIVIAPFIFSQNAKGHSISSISNPLLIDTVKKLVWSDEFDIPGLPNKSKWAYDIGTGDHGWGNNELEYYTKDSLSNAKVSGGQLILTALQQKLGGREYTSARLVTRGKASWTYGRIIVRAKIPKGVGIWPAIWMLGNNIHNKDIGWPLCGEIDIMEHTGTKPGNIQASVHTKSNNWILGTQKTDSIHIADYGDAFHNYQLDWDKNIMTISIDGKKLLDYHNDGKGKNSWPFDDPIYLLLNIAVGGNYSGFTIDEKALPAKMVIDYVRVYQ